MFLLFCPALAAQFVCSCGAMRARVATRGHFITAHLAHAASCTTTQSYEEEIDVDGPSALR
jgi:hypothetical protein